MTPTITKIPVLKTADEFARRVSALGVELGVDRDIEPDGPLAQPVVVHGRTIGNRFCVLPMEGWDGSPDGRPTELTRRRWTRFGESGAKLIWGCEAVAVRRDGRANPGQLLPTDELAGLRDALVSAHRDRHGCVDDLLVGLQLTHSGRFSRPNDKARLEPFIAYRHPVLDSSFRLPASQPVASDGEIDGLVSDFVRAAVRAQNAGFDFVDVKHCHGYFAHELLSAVERPGRYGGDLENRTRFLRNIVEGIRRDAPGLHVAVRLSVFDGLPYEKGSDGRGVPVEWSGRYPYAFGANADDPSSIDWREPRAFLRLLRDLEIRLVCLTAGSPYYNPHIQRPALYPPSDGYRPPEDPLVGVARQIASVARARLEVPELVYVGSGYSYLQEWLPNAAQHQVRTEGTDFVGLGRMVLSYPELPADVLGGRGLQRNRLCRTFSDCTTGPRNGLVSGCFPLDDFYRQHPDRVRLKEAKARLAIVTAS